MQNKPIKVTALLVVVFLAVSCGSMSNLNLDVLRPAEVTIDPEILSVVVVDNSLPYRGEGIHLVTTPKGKGMIDTLWIDDFPKIAAVSMVEALQNKQFFDAVYYHRETRRSFQSEDMLYRKIENLCNQYNVQAVVLLEDYSYKSKLSLYDLRDVYYGTMDVNGSISWKIYEKDGYLLDSYNQKDSIFWDAYENRYAAVLNKLPRQVGAVEVLADYLGEAYTKRVAPYWETVSRKYYSKGHYMFLRANELHFIDNWDEAAKVWYYVYQNGNKRQKALAAFNIALSYEVRGNFDEAVAWGEISQVLFNKLGGMRSSRYEKNITKYYTLQLIERQQQKTKLDEQIGGS